MPCRLLLKQTEERTLQMEHSAQERVRRMAFQNVEVVRANGRQQEVIRELKRHVRQLLAWQFNQNFGSLHLPCWLPEPSMYNSCLADISL